MHDNNDLLSSRRMFLGALAAGTAGLATAPQNVLATMHQQTTADVSEADEWLKKIKGKHKILYDAPEVHDGFPIIWTWVYYQTNNQTGSPDSDLTAVVVLRHNAIPLAMQDSVWAKYKFGDAFKVTDNNTSASSVRNPYYEPQGKDFPMPAIQGIKAMQARGAMFCVCDMALTVYSMMTAQSMNLKPEDVKKEWVAALQPGVQVVPSGVWAIGRAQEKGCAYCYAGG
jgi:intracellular sulfur oxidation DsrE/DsrF family protein